MFLSGLGSAQTTNLFVGALRQDIILEFSSTDDIIFTENTFANISNPRNDGIRFERESQDLGPSLSEFQVANTLQDPTLDLHDSSGNFIASNDDWQTATNADQILINLQPSDYPLGCQVGVVPFSVARHSLIVFVPRFHEQGCFESQ